MNCRLFFYFPDYALAAKYFKKTIVLPEMPFTTRVINDVT